MSDGYDGAVLTMTFRLATESVAAEGITKAAGGGYSRRLAAHAHMWMPLAEALAGPDSGMAGIREQMDGNLQILRGIHDADQARKAARAQMPSQARPPEPQLLPVDLEQTRLHAAFGPAGEPAHVNGYGATAPDGGAA